MTPTTQAPAAPDPAATNGDAKRVRDKVKAAKDRYKRATATETAKALAEDIPRLQTELADLHAEIADAEQTFLEGLSATLERRAEVDMTLARARVGREYVAVPSAYAGHARPTREDQKRTNAYEIVVVSDEREQAERELRLTPPPVGSIAAQLGDSKAFAQAEQHRKTQNRVLELQNKLAKLERRRDTEFAL
jgi:hypothetical protein